MEWYKRWRARKIWRSMLNFYMVHGEEMEAHKAAHFVLAMDYIKQVSEGKS